MLAIRLQRTGRKGHAQFRMLVQDSHRAPTSGRFVAALGSYDPHTKELTIDKEKAQLYLKNGAQPSDRVARLLKKEGIKLPSWVALEVKKKRAVKNPEKLRKNQPAKPVEEKPAEEAAPAAAEETVTETTAAEEVVAEEGDTAEEAAAEDEKPAEA